VTDALAPDAVYQRNPSILFNDFDDGIMMMDIDSGQYFDIDTIGTSIWKLLEQPASLQTICAGLADQYDVDAETCMADTQAFFAELDANGLIQRV
jgi:hypothetical protein